MAGPWDAFPVVETPKAAAADPWAAFPAVGSQKPGVIEDMAKAAPSAVARGVLGIPGLPGTVAGGLRWMADKAADQTVGRLVNYAQTGSLAAPDGPSTTELQRQRGRAVGLDQVASGEDLVDYAAKAVPGIKYQPQTVPGEYTRTVGEFLPGLLSPGTTFEKIVGGVVVPAVTSETFGQIARKFAPSLEPVARIFGGIGGSVASTVATRPATAEKALSGALQGVDDATMVRAGQLMEAAQQRGVALTWPEAVNQVSNGAATGLSSLQHVVENSRGGAGTMGSFMAPRPAQVEAAGRQAFDQVASLPENPSMLGGPAQTAARQAVGETPEGQVLAQRLWEAGPRMSPERAGQIIQPEIRAVYEKREGMRAALADQDYTAARNAPATIPQNGDFGFRSVTSHFDGPDIPILTDPAQRASARSVQLAERNPTEVMPVVGLRPTEFGQVDAASVVQHLEGVIASAKGTAQRALTAAKNALYRPDGSVDVSVAGLHNSREAIGDLISEAKRAGANNTVRELEGALGTLDQALEAVPAYGQARRHFEAASQPLAPFGENRVPGQIVARDQFNKDFVMPPEQAPHALTQGGPSATRDFNAVASGPAREAFEAHLTTQILDTALQGGRDISANAIRLALRQNEDMLAQFPGVRTRLENIAAAREGLAALDNTPLGKIAKRDATTESAVKAIFPENPLPGTASEVKSAVSALADKNPMVARQLVRIHAESIFNQAVSQLQGGANQFGGAGFVAALKGNPQQAKNLSASIEASAGPEVARGFDEFLDIMSATGQRVRGGSRTAFNQEAQDVLKRGGAIGEAANAVATGGIKLPAQIKERYEQWRLGKNTGDIARLITDPNALPMFRRLAEAAPGSNRAQAIAARLTAMSLQATQSLDNPIVKAR